ncbi:signal peptidase I [Desulfomonile tiedjei]|uniref:Signal peptidase I n=1 Tax=Desulfomonile tiedjei (strain ATCC 49306 / DSM 6799 / DCB-1) TaxID=706587 RepID=I4CCQ9_DESTA|nr:signal peptidase I [Desulfomonile tiedjei]AFM27350.1 signal peptidase I [Desulfomonile tiedjei DSM 6799]
MQNNPSPNSTEPLMVMLRGRSMHPTLRAGDALFVKPAVKVVPGDVVVYLCPRENTPIAHRVVSVGENEIKTRGDNNPSTDLFPVRISDILGKVEQFERKGCRKRLQGGLCGRIQALYVRARKTAINVAVASFRSIYRMQCVSGIFARLLPVKPRVVRFENSGKPRIQLLLGKRVIGEMISEEGWYIKPPFRLFVGEDLLPTPGENAKENKQTVCAIEKEQ